MIDKVQKIRKKVEKLMYGFNLEADIASCEDAETEKLADIKYQLCKKILDYIDEVQKEPVNDDLEEAAKRYATEGDEISGLYIIDEEADAFKAGAKWQKENLWKPADGNDLPIFDREVIVFTQPYPLEGTEYAVSFAHRPNPDGWDGKSLTSGKVEHYTPKTYDKGGWNQSDIKWWLDVEFPKAMQNE